MSGRILGYVMARNEWPLLGLAITHALTDVVDEVIVVDHASCDNTAAGLAHLCEAWPGRITVFRLHNGAYLQEATTRVILAAAGASEYEWIYVFDADEFLLSKNNEGLRAILADVPETVGAVRYEVHQWIAPHNMRDRAPEDYYSITQRTVPCIFTNPPSEIVGRDIEQGYFNFFDIPFPSKVIIRSKHARELAAGSHAVNNLPPDRELVLTPDRLRVGHLPMLTRERLSMKCRQGQALMEAGMPPWHGWQSQMLRRIELAGGLNEFWATHSDQQGNIKPSNSAPTSEEDKALADALRTSISCFKPSLWNPETKTARDQQPAVDLDTLIAMTHTLNIERDQCMAERESQERDSQIARLRAMDLETELEEERARVLALTKSHSWALTKPLREAMRWLITTTMQVKHYANYSLQDVRTIKESKSRLLNELPNQGMALQKSSNQSLSSIQQMAITLNKPLPFSRKVLRWGYQRMPLPIATKRQIWTRLMLIKGRFKGNPGMAPLDSVTVPTLTPEEQLAIIRSLTFPKASKEVAISIIIPCYNQIHYTLSCLASILKHPPSVDYEVIIINDASPIDDYHILDQVDGLVAVHNQQNAGYLESCNTGMRVARGLYICLLNNDVHVLPDSFDALLRTFKRMPSAGLVGSKLIYPTGQLQEAGGIVWNDGFAWNVGRLRDINEPQFNYLRSVDYCSAASIMIPKRVLETLAGFDPKYKPAYYEDTDLAFRIRNLGLDVLYQPKSVIIHYEGISHGKAVNQGLKKHQLINAETFYATWQSKLKRHRPNGKDYDQEKDRGFGLRVLLIDKCTPSPDRDAGSVVLLNLMLILRHLGYQPTFIPDDNYANVTPYTPLCQSLGIECLYHPYVTSVKQHLEQFGSRYDLVILFRPDLSQCHLQLVRHLCPRAKVIYYPHDLHYIRMLRESALKGKQSLKNHALKSKKIELDLSQRADSTIVVSITEKEELNRQIPDARVDYLPLIINELTNSRPARFGGGDLVFMGNFNHTPNEDAVCWFAESVLPLIHRALPDTIFHVIGANPPASVCRLAGTNMVIHGFVEDLDSLLSTMTLSVAPIRFGAGMKGKIVSAMRAGLPVVCTSIGSEGMQLDDRNHAYIADDAASFADAVLEILSSQAIWEHLRQAGIDLCSERWGKQASINGMRQILAGIGLATAAQHGPESLTLYPFD